MSWLQRRRRFDRSSPPSGRLVLAVCLVTGFATLFDSAALVVAAPILRADLGADASSLQWILAGYSLTFGLALIPAGRLGDAVGRPVLLAAGLLLFSTASIVGATAAEPTALVIARLVQGVGAGTANPQVIGLLQDRFSGSARARALGAYTSVGSAAALLAPVVAGGVLDAAEPGLGWRVVVLLNVPLGCLAATLSLVFLARRLVRARRDRPVDVDPMGLIAVTVLTLLLLLPVVSQESEPLRWAAGGVLFAAVATVFVWWERRYARRGRLPLITPALVRAPGFTMGCLVATFTFGSALGFSAVLMLFLQEALDLGPFAAGVVTIPGAIASMVTANLSWRVLRRFGRPGVTVILALKTAIAVTAAIALLAVPTSWVLPVLVAMQTLTGAVSGLAGPPNQALTLEHAPHDQHGVAAGVLQVSQRISATLCIAALVGLYASASPGADLDVGGARTALVLVATASAVLGALATACSAVDAATTRARVPERAPSPTAAG
ncbi:MFS transporter [Pseudactinotalea sp.]|uniref:MFS transporter n=1 Tax=Pseudactinotalea sp. TaxID=1926260 RepID=UPI003B3B5F0B